ncbi:MAG TPA: D-glucuronyl C5-epimerase family protein [Polyangiaceae bacterium]|nr:D-glucuronyl C5-epimerase family protein [Polyangiaceae bacterium]
MASVLGLTGFAACGDNANPGSTEAAGGEPASLACFKGVVASGEGGGCATATGLGGAGEGGVPEEGGSAAVAGSAGAGAGAGGSGAKGGTAGAAGTTAGAGIGGEGGAGGAGGVGGVGGEAGSPDSPIDSADVVVLPIDQRPYTECEAFKKGAAYDQDEDGMPLKLYKGNYYEHPVLLAQAGLEWLACYREGNDTWYLEHAIAAGHHLVAMSHDIDGAMFFPYHFDYLVHGNKANAMVAPWYSGMAQGQVLSLFSRLGELTSDVEWQEAAAATLLSFNYVNGKTEPWIIDIDENNSVWIEEYPIEREKHVLNGFMFAMFGLYDYYAWQGDAFAKKVFLQSLHTLRLNVESFRNPGAISVYCLAHRRNSNGYHAIHIGQLQAMTRMTNDPYFASVADLFAEDYAP